MKREHVGTLVFAAVVLVVTYLFYIIYRPFLKPLLWGAVFAGMFYPLNARIGRKLKKKNIRALLMCVIVVAVIGVPTVFLSVGLIGEVVNVAPKFSEAVESGKLDMVFKPEAFGWNEKIKETLGPYVDVSNLDIELMISTNLQRLSSFLIEGLSNLVGNVSLAKIDVRIGGDRSFSIDQLGHEIMTEDMRWQVIFRASNPGDIFTTTKRQEAQYKGGEVISRLAGDNHVEVTMVGWPGEKIWFEFYRGRLQGVLELTGKKGTVDMKPIDSETNECKYDIRWD